METKFRQPDNCWVMGARLQSFSPFKGKFGGPDGTALLLTHSTETELFKNFAGLLPLQMLGYFSPNLAAIKFPNWVFVNAKNLN